MTSRFFNENDSFADEIILIIIATKSKIPRNKSILLPL